MIRTVVIFCFDNQKFPGIQYLQPFQQCIPFLKPGISAAVDTQHQDPALFQKGQGYGKCLNTGFCPCGKSMIALRQIAEIEYNAAYTHRLCVFSHIYVGIQKQFIIVRGIFFFKPLSGIGKCYFLNIESEYMPFSPQRQERSRVSFPFPMVASMQRSPSFTCSEIKWAHHCVIW